ncbi:MAG: hypothetical protein GYB31_10520 [Bacteroidetes bacterium]|nr:hypothetical protein [Bacteroidota bacterium]
MINILSWLEKLQTLHPTTTTLLNRALVHLQLDQPEEAGNILFNIEPGELAQRAYLYFGCLSEYHSRKGEKEKALEALQTAIQKTSNQAEKEYLQAKRNQL